MGSPPATPGPPRRPLLGSAVVVEAAASREGWQARLELGFEANGVGSRLVRNAHAGPLRVQKPFDLVQRDGTPGPCAAIVLHPPGGIVGGDRLELEVEVQQGASALVTTPGATRFYRSLGDRVGEQSTRARVAAGASLEWLPQETLFFDGTRASLSTRFDLEGDARLVAWEIAVFGRPASGERFERGEAATSLEIHRDDAPLWIDRATWAGGDPAFGAAWGMRGASCVGTLVCVGAGPEVLAALRHGLESTQGGNSAGCTALGDVVLCRALGDSSREVLDLFTKLWQGVRPMMLGAGLDPPRIWAT